MIFKLLIHLSLYKIFYIFITTKFIEKVDVTGRTRACAFYVFGHSNALGVACNVTTTYFFIFFFNKTTNTAEIHTRPHSRSACNDRVVLDWGRASRLGGASSKTTQHGKIKNGKLTETQLSEVAAADLLADPEVGPHHEHPRAGDGVTGRVHRAAA